MLLNVLTCVLSTTLFVKTLNEKHCLYFHDDLEATSIIYIITCISRLQIC